jgi:putative membrane protein
MIPMLAPALALFMLTSPFLGAQRTPTPESTPSAAAAADGQFVLDAATGGAAEIALAKLALETSSRGRIKSLAQRLLSDHDTANQQLRELATLKQLDWPAGPDKAQKATYARLSMLSGSQFDRVYLEEMLQGHRMAIATFQREAMDGSDAELKAWGVEDIAHPRSPLRAHRRFAEIVNPVSLGRKCCA